MKAAFLQLWRDNRLLLIAFMLACVLTGVFGGRAAMDFIYWSDPEHRDQDIAGWMTPGYISHSWKVPPEIIGGAMGFTTKPPGRPPTVEIVAEQQGVEPGELAARIEAAIAEFRSQPARSE